MRSRVVPPDPCTKVSSMRACSSRVILPAAGDGCDRNHAVLPTCYLLFFNLSEKRKRFGERRRERGQKGATAPRRHGPLGRAGPLRPELHERRIPPQG